ncbi:hypothetical protein LTR48_000593 [Friedmanniomyces endolithicus]|uniref:CCHC-type domain-containing protein n=1 Tax=Rachicladosporium monterosium TaxID=1507873 RepID=A0ABR0LFV1_9PEZI|nr:hypothetical protein LTR48_000593 [Friedmanniomyces endolithicus]KAK5148176.1 hypothetical protein LTR32_000488 [Rachicladosporium monterosium]
MARTKAASKKRKADAQLDMIEGATSRQDVLDNRLTTQPNESDSRTNAVGRKRQRTDGVPSRELTLPDIEPKQLRHQIKVEMQKRGNTAIEALMCFTHPGRPNRTIAQKFLKTWMQTRHGDVSVRETSEETVDRVSDGDFSVGEVTPVTGGNGVGSDDEIEVRQARPYQEHTNLGKRAGKAGASDGPAVSNIRPKLLRKAIGREMKRTQNSLMDILAAFCQPEMPYHEVAQDLFNRWYGPGGAVANGPEPEPVPERDQAEVGLISDRDDVSVGEVTPTIAPSIDHDPEPRSASCYNCGSDSHWGDDCDSLPHFLLEKVGEGGTWSARNADQYVDYGEAGPPQQQGPGRNRGARRSPPPQAYQLQHFDDYGGDW